MERETQESWALFYETGLPQAYTYLKERQKRQQEASEHKQHPPRAGRSGEGR